MLGMKDFFESSRLRETSLGQRQIATPMGLGDITWCKSCHRNSTRGIFGGEGRTDIEYVCTECIEKYGQPPLQMVPGTEHI